MSAPTFDWRGVNHARMTADMEDLPLGPLRALMRLRRLVGDGSAIRIQGGVRGLGAFFEQSEGWIKKHVLLLEQQRYIDAIWADDGSTVITVLPPPPLRSGSDHGTQDQPAPQATAPAFRSGSDQNRSEPDHTSKGVIGQQDASSVDSARSGSDQRIFLESCIQQQQQHGADSKRHSGSEQHPEPRIPNPESEIKNSLREPAQRSGGAGYTQTGTTADRTALEAAMLKQPKADPIAVAKALAGRPGGTLAQFLGDPAAAESRPDVETPLGLVLAAWADGKGVATQRPARRAADTPTTAPPSRSQGRRVPRRGNEEQPIDPAKAAAEWGLQRGSDVRLPPATPIEQPAPPPTTPGPPTAPRPARPEATRPLEPAPQRNAFARWRSKK